ncbi:MAG: hypothetical protein U0S48_11115 [Solirubrobacteraceae bacterium]
MVNREESTMTIAPDDVAQRQLKAFFEEGCSVGLLLATLRSRRVAMGYQIESGEEETSTPPAAGCISPRARSPRLQLRAPGRPAHRDRGGDHRLVGLRPQRPCTGTSPRPAAYLFVGIAGRTAAAAGNSFATDLLIIKDEGTYIYNPGDHRDRLVEIQGLDDYHKVVDWYRNGLTKVLDGRPDIDWATPRAGCPERLLFGPYQYNVNRPGTTWFIPITDHGWLYFNVMLNIRTRGTSMSPTTGPARRRAPRSGSARASSSSRSRSASSAAHLLQVETHAPGFDGAEHAPGRRVARPGQLDLLRLLRRRADGGRSRTSPRA